MNALELKQKIESYADEDGWVDYKNLTPTVKKDLDEVEFDTENITGNMEYPFGPESILGIQELSDGTPFFGVCAGGDCDLPLFFCIFWDGNELRGYIPSKGNIWNQETKKAYKAYNRHQNQYSFDSDALKSDIKEQLSERHSGNKILVCPKCANLPTFSYGCKHCGSFNVEKPKLIHHFACAYVGYVQEFANFTCPKCLMRNLISGKDFGHAFGPYYCKECGWHGNDREIVGKCTKCQFLFPIRQSKELIG